MDKFGIFNLLNSFFSLSKPENQKTDNAGTPNSDLLSSLLSSFTNSKKPENKSEKSVDIRDVQCYNKFANLYYNIKSRTLF